MKIPSTADPNAGIRQAAHRNATAALRLQKIAEEGKRDAMSTVRVPLSDLVDMLDYGRIVADALGLMLEIRARK